jgi:hypothetical protein
MSSPYINLYFQPPVYGKYSNEEVLKEIIDSTKAFHVCQSVAQEFASCRKMPLGRLVEPERCLGHGKSLMNCYNLVKTIPEKCKASYDNISTCLKDKNNYCEAQMNDYISCEHPAYLIYKDYPNAAEN